MERGFVSPVATSATWYPDATLGLMPLVGVSVAEQLDDDDVPYAGTTRELKRRRAAVEIGDIMKRGLAPGMRSCTQAKKTVDINYIYPSGIDMEKSKSPTPEVISRAKTKMKYP